MSSLQANEHMCRYCFDVLSTKLQHGQHKSVPDFDGVDTSIHCPLFVTLHVVRHGEKDLRGCIGTLSDAHLASSLQSYTVSSAFKDGRFRPLELSELPTIELSVSLLVQYERGDHCYDWTVGIHGIIIEFHVNGRKFNATYLPEVASEQRWSQKDAVHSLIRKAGYRENVSKDVLESISLTRYQSSKYSLSYDSYVKTTIS